MGPAGWYLLGLATIPGVVLIAVVLGTVYRNARREREWRGDDWW